MKFDLKVGDYVRLKHIVKGRYPEHMHNKRFRVKGIVSDGKIACVDYPQYDAIAIKSLERCTPITRKIIDILNGEKDGYKI